MPHWTCFLAVAIAVASPFAALAEEGTTVYQSDFANGADLHWSHDDVTLKDEEVGGAYLGPFEKQSVKLSLQELPAHQFVVISFDLLTFGRWEGQQPRMGPDIIKLTADDGRVLMESTFSSYVSMSQSFPDRALTANHAVDQNNKLRRTLRFVLPHDKEKLSLTLTGHLLDLHQIHRDGRERWGIAEVEVQTFAKSPKPVTDESIDSLIAKLRSDDAGAAFAAMQELIGGGNATVQLLTARAPFKHGSDLPKRVQTLVANLDSPDADDFDTALRELVAIGDPAMPALMTLREQPLSVPQWAGIEVVMASMRDHPVLLFENRLAHVLRMIDSGEARELLGELPGISDDKHHRVALLDLLGMLRTRTEAIIRSSTKNGRVFEVQLRMTDADGKPMADRQVELSHTAGTQKLSTNAAGMLHLHLTPDNTQRAKLTFPAEATIHLTPPYQGEQVFPPRVGN